MLLDTEYGSQNTHWLPCCKNWCLGTFRSLNYACLVMPNSLRPCGLQAPLSMRFPRQECCSGLPFPPPGDLPDPGIEPVSLVAAALVGRFFTSEPPGKPSLS